MVKKINIKDIQAELQEFDLQKVIVVRMNQTQTKEICLACILLNERLVDSLEFELKNITLFVQLSLDNICRYSLYDIAKKIFKGVISKNSLEYLIHFLLKYFRDEIGEAEHIDIDFENKENDTVTLTVKIDSFKEYSPSELDKLLKDR